MRVYSIRNWQTVYEKSDAKRMRADKAMEWVPIPTKHDGIGYKRLMRSDRWDGMQIHSAFVLMVQVAAKMPTRGVLKNADGPLTPDDLADKTEGRKEIFEKAFEVLSNPEFGINWLEVSEDTNTYSHIDALYREDRIGQTGQDRTGQEKTEHTASAVSPGKPATPSPNGKHPTQRPRRAQPTGKHHELIAFFTDRWREKYQAAYDFGTKDAAHIKSILTKLEGNLARAEEIIEAYLADDDGFYLRDRHSLGVLVSQFRRFAVAEPAQVARTATGSDVSDPNVIGNATDEQIEIARQA